MHRNTQVIGTAFVVATITASAALVVLGHVNKLIHFLSFVFFIAAGTAFWCAFQKHDLIEFAVGVMYATGIAIAALMIRRTVLTGSAKDAESKQSSDSKSK